MELIAKAMNERHRYPKPLAWTHALDGLHRALRSGGLFNPLVQNSVSPESPEAALAAGEAIARADEKMGRGIARQMGRAMQAFDAASQEVINQQKMEEENNGENYRN